MDVNDRMVAIDDPVERNAGGCILASFHTQIAPERGLRDFDDQQHVCRIQHSCLAQGLSKDDGVAPDDRLIGKDDALFRAHANGIDQCV